jgi:hypothetical protein
LKRSESSASMQSLSLIDSIAGVASLFGPGIVTGSSDRICYGYLGLSNK